MTAPLHNAPHATQAFDRALADGQTWVLTRQRLPQSGNVANTLRFAARVLSRLRISLRQLSPRDRQFVFAFMREFAAHRTVSNIERVARRDAERAAFHAANRVPYGTFVLNGAERSTF